MFGLSRSVTLALVGWLWADILLGLFVVFLAAASPPITDRSKLEHSVDPQPVELTVPVDGSALLSTDDATVKAAQTKFADAVKEQLLSRSETRRVAIVFAYGAHQDPSNGEKLAQVATADLNTGQFEGATVKTLHDIVAGDQGTHVALEIYVYR
jgi:hypothetical protein